MKHKGIMAGLGTIAVALTLLGARSALAHCDGIDGPVVKAAQNALQTNNVNLVRIWVRKEDEPELTKVFEQAVAVRNLSPESRALADRQLFETVVRLHRSGEGAAYTGLKPAGRDLGPAIPAADRAIETGDPAALEKTPVERCSEWTSGGIRARSSQAEIRRERRPGRARVRQSLRGIHSLRGTSARSGGRPGNWPFCRGRGSLSSHAAAKPTDALGRVALQANSVYELAS